MRHPHFHAEYFILGLAKVLLALLQQLHLAAALALQIMVLSTR